MNRTTFESMHRKKWAQFAILLSEAEKRNPEMDVSQVPALFREICNHLSLAKERRYGQLLCDELNELVIRGYNTLRISPPSTWAAFVDFVSNTFPKLVRKEWKLFWICTLFFLVPYGLVCISAKYEIAWIEAILGPAGMQSMSDMYGAEDTSKVLRREHGSNFMMFCFYIWNNVRIDFQIFAGGILGGVGTLFFLLFNGVYIGAAAGYVHYIGDPNKFYSFVIGHSSFELIGMVVAGMAGMKLGMGVLRPGRLSRRDAMVACGKESLPLIYGAALLTTVAAVFEGFWSAQPLPYEIKYTAGALIWASVIAYFLFSGRRQSGSR